MAETTLPKLRVSRKDARQKLQTQIEKGQQFYERLKSDELDKVGMEANNWSTYNINLLRKLFDTPVPVDEYTKFRYNRLTLDEMKNIVMGNTHFLDIDQYQVYKYRGGMKDSVNSLEGIRDRLELYDEPSETPQRTSGNENISDNSTRTFADKVFIVHGHDNEAKVTIARFVENLGIEATILDEEVNEGQTIPEKFEEHADDAGFAIILLTPDDVGASKNEQGNLKPRARQNVVLELGYFWGRLGRKRLCVLYKEGIELPSDMSGIVYVPMNSSDGWQLQLAREMKQAGLPIDPQKLL